MNNDELTEAIKLPNWVDVRNFYDLLRNVCKKEFEVTMHYLNGLFIYVNRPNYAQISEERIESIRRLASKRGARSLHYIDGLLTIDF